MKLYNYKVMVRNRNGASKWLEERTHWTKYMHKAKKEMEEDIKFLSKFWEVVDYSLMEKENGMDVYEGYVKDNGCYDKDFSPTVGCVPITEMIYDKYNGLKVKVTVEVLDS